jgi:hypothetical protein
VSIYSVFFFENLTIKEQYAAKSLKVQYGLFSTVPNCIIVFFFENLTVKGTAFGDELKGTVH